MAREATDTTKYTKDLPKFGDVLKAKRAHIKNLATDRVKVYLEWDFSDRAKQFQIVRLITEKKGERHETALSVQELQHYLRAV